MKNKIDEFCSPCLKKSYCMYPCGDFYDFFQNPKNSNPCKSMDTEDEKPDKNTVSSTECKCNCKCEYSTDHITDYLNIDVESDDWLNVVNNKKTIESVISWDSLFMYMDTINRDYCRDHGLCESCRSELIATREQYEYWGSKVSEKYLICPRCKE